MEDGVSFQEQGDFAEQFRLSGFAGPKRIYSSAQCKLVNSYLKNITHQETLVWHKGLAATDPFILNLAAHLSIINCVKELIGPDVILWGASQIIRQPGQIHHWHTDIESSAPEGGFVSVWIGIENTEKLTGLKFIRGSHLFGRTLQEDAYRVGLRRDETDDRIVIELARKHDLGATIAQPQVMDGDTIFFDGRIWHGSRHSAPIEARTALLFQYATVHKKVYCLDPEHLEWPFRMSRSRPPCIVLTGKSADNINLLVPPPRLPSGPISAIGSLAHQFDLDLRPSASEPWKAVHAIRGATPILKSITCHASVLAPEHSPHVPHAHIEEELLVVLSGVVEIIIPSGEHDADPRKERLRPGDFAYYPAYQWHTLQNVGRLPATYVMFKWHGGLSQADSALPLQVVRGDLEKLAPNDFNADIIFEGPTCYLDRLHAHLTTLRPGGGYEPHRDEYDVAIVVLEGRVALLGQELTAGGVAYCVASEDHDMRNMGEGAARYLVFEFERSNCSDWSPLKMPLTLRLRDLARRIRRRLKSELRSVYRSFGRFDKSTQ